MKKYKYSSDILFLKIDELLEIGLYELSAPSYKKQKWCLLHYILLKYYIVYDIVNIKKIDA